VPDKAATASTSIIEKLKPKLPCQGRFSSSSSLHHATHELCVGVAPSRRLPIDILKDLEISSSSDDEEEASDVCTSSDKAAKNSADFTEAATLDGMKLRINLKLVRRETELKKRKRPITLSESSSCSMEEDLPLLSDSPLSPDSSSESDVPPKKRVLRSSFQGNVAHSSDDEEPEESDQVKTDVEIKNWLPYREPMASNQEEMVQQEVHSMLEYDM